MSTDVNKTRDELLNELKQYRETAVENDLLRERLKRAEDECQTLQTRLEKRERDFIRERAEHITAVKELGMAQLIVDRSPVVLFRRKAGDDPQLEYISDNLRQFGYAPEEFFKGEIIYRDIVYEKDQDRVGDEIHGFADADLEEYTQHYRLVTKSGEIRWVEDQTSVVRDEAGTKIHNQGILIDITDRKLAEEKLRKSEEKFRRIVETAAEGFLLMDEDLNIIDVNNAYCRMLGYAREELLGKAQLDFATDGFRAFMLANKETLLAQEYREFEGSVIAKNGHSIPILIHGNSLRDDHGSIIGNMAFITDMTEHKKALILAGEVQKSLLPHEKPQVTGLDIAGRNVSCDEIGGDYFDFLWRHDSRKGAFSIVVGDISGHGVDSALLMTTARAFLRMRASQPGTISEIISEMNSHLAGDVLDTGKFMTLFYLTIDPEQRNLSWVRAGHDPALVYTPDSDEFEELKGSGIALGVTDDFDYMAHRKEGLKNGQIIAVGTDGIWEAFNSEGEMFGKNRLCEIIRKHAGASADEILNEVYVGLNMFMSGIKSEDDITLVIIKVDGLDEFR
ncbi:MAG: SpoIIE family protein phosphatase [Desulforhopalus sp.]|nr:SpoIIE family protein phosphatase [Desulforhopalus sp.]